MMIELKPEHYKILKGIGELDAIWESISKAMRRYREYPMMDSKYYVLYNILSNARDKVYEAIRELDNLEITLRKEGK